MSEKPLKSLAVVMARGGSKRIPRKNVKVFSGKPAVAWPVEAAVKSGLFGDVVISTEDTEIAEIACSHGAHRPFVRPAELANDYALTLDVIRHALAASDTEYDLCCCMYGTSVFITPQLLEEGKKLILSPERPEAVMCAVQFEHPPQRGFTVKNSIAGFVCKEAFPARTQDLDPVYHDVGLFYWLDVKAFMEKKVSSLAELKVAPIILPRNFVVDIDTEEDWAEAEKIVSKRGTP